MFFPKELMLGAAIFFGVLILLPIYAFWLLISAIWPWILGAAVIVFCLLAAPGLIYSFRREVKKWEAERAAAKYRASPEEIAAAKLRNLPPRKP